MKKETDYTDLLLKASRGPKGETKKGRGFLSSLGKIQRRINQIKNKNRRAVEQEMFDKACEYGP